MVNALRIGVGAAAILIGIYVALKEFSLGLTILGLILVAIGIGVITSD